MDQEALVVDLEPYLARGVAGDLKDCHRLVEILRDTSLVIVRDPRVSSEDNDRYLDLMERYFAQPDEVIAKDKRPEFHYQVGVSEREMPRDHRALIATMPVEHWPYLTPRDYPGDPRWRFFRNLGTPPPETKFPRLNAPQVIPAGFEAEWATTMDTWGEKMLASIYTIAEMIAVSFNLPLHTFTEKFRNAPHLIAPNGVDLVKYQREGTVFNAFHYDLNWGTIHGRARFPGLRLWPRAGAPFVARVPEGCLLFQVAKQLEWQTGGYFRAGFHEVVQLHETLAAVGTAIWTKHPAIRVSSTVFGHVASDELLAVLDNFVKAIDPTYRSRVLALYPPILTGHQVEQELEAIGFKKD